MSRSHAAKGGSVGAQARRLFATGVEDRWRSVAGVAILIAVALLSPAVR